MTPGTSGPHPPPGTTPLGDRRFVTVRLRGPLTTCWVRTAPTGGPSTRQGSGSARRLDQPDEFDNTERRYLTELAPRRHGRQPVRLRGRQPHPVSLSASSRRRQRDEPVSPRRPQTHAFRPRGCQSLPRSRRGLPLAERQEDVAVLSGRCHVVVAHHLDDGHARSEPAYHPVLGLPRARRVPGTQPHESAPSPGWSRTTRTQFPAARPGCVPTRRQQSGQVTCPTSSVQPACSAQPDAPQVGGPACHPGITLHTRRQARRQRSPTMDRRRGASGVVDLAHRPSGPNR